MTTSRRTIIAAAGAGLAAIGSARAEEAPASARAADLDREVDGLLRTSAEANAALMRGEIDAYRRQVPYADDFTLMSPFGGAPSHGPSFTEDKWRAMQGFFRNGSLDQEVVQTYATPDMAVLVVIERTNVEVGGLPAQDWALRVTLVYRRDAGVWRLAHRHADPLVRGISLDAVAALAR